MTKYWALSIALLAPAALLAQHNTSHKLSPELRGEGAHQGSIHVIVQFKHSLNLSHEEKIRGKGGVVDAKLGIVKGVAATLPDSALATLASDDDVAYISPDRPLKSNVDRCGSAFCVRSLPVESRVRWDRRRRRNHR